MNQTTTTILLDLVRSQTLWLNNYKFLLKILHKYPPSFFFIRSELETERKIREKDISVL